MALWCYCNPNSEQNLWDPESLDQELVEGGESNQCFHLSPLDVSRSCDILLCVGHLYESYRTFSMFGVDRRRTSWQTQCMSRLESRHGKCGWSFLSNLVSGPAPGHSKFLPQSKKTGSLGWAESLNGSGFSMCLDCGEGGVHPVMAWHLLISVFQLLTWWMLGRAPMHSVTLVTSAGWICWNTSWLHSKVFMQQSVVGVFLIKDVPQATGISLHKFLDCSIAQLRLSSLHMDFNPPKFHFSSLWQTLTGSTTPRHVVMQRSLTGATLAKMIQLWLFADKQPA